MDIERTISLDKKTRYTYSLKSVDKTKVLNCLHNTKYTQLYKLNILRFICVVFCNN